MSEQTPTSVRTFPNDWVYQEIGPRIDMTTGPAFDSTRFDDDPSGIRLARGINITKGHFRWYPEITKYWPKVSPDIEKYLLHVNDVIIGMDGSLVGRNYAIVTSNDIPALLVQRVARLRPDESLDARYLYYWIASEFWLAYVEVVKTHSGIPHISNGDIREFKIGSPPLSEQRKIARILTTLDNLIEKTESLIAKYQAVKQGMMHDLFTRGVDAHGKLRPPQSEAPELYKQSELGWIPKDWGCRRLSEVVQLQVGFAFKSSWFLDQGTMRLLRGENVGQGTPDWSDTKFLPSEMAWQFREYALREGDVVIGMDRTFTKTGVKITQLREEDCPVLLVQRVGRFLPLHCESAFLRCFLDYERYHTDLARQQKGMDIPHLSQTEILEPWISVPPSDEQNRLSTRLDSLNGTISSELECLKKLNRTKSGLMHDLLTGRVRVKVEESKEAAAHG